MLLLLFHLISAAGRKPVETNQNASKSVRTKTLIKLLYENPSKPIEMRPHQAKDWKLK